MNWSSFRLWGGLAALALSASSVQAQTWYDSSWPYRKSVTVNHLQVAGALGAFPVMVSAVDADLSKARADGFDLLFTGSDGTTKLAHEIEKFVAGTGELVAWVNVSGLNPTTDTLIYLYYGNASSPNQQQPTLVWDASFRGVWHLHDDFLDSTSNAVHGTNNGSTDLAGRIADGQDFDGINDWIGLGTGCFATATWTVEFWVRPNNPGDFERIFFQGDGGCATRQFTAYWHTPARLEVYTSTTGSLGSPQAETAPVDPSDWLHFAWTFDGAVHSLYVDGQPSSGSVTTSSNVSVQGDNYIARRASGSFWTGGVDEVRISDAVRSAAWIATQFNNQDSPGTFLTLGPEEILRSIVKRAFQSDGTPIADGATLPAQIPLKFLLYINNPAVAATDLSVRDVLGATFQYQSGSILVDSSLLSTAVCPAHVCDESAIFSQVDGAGTSLGDGDSDGDVASYTAATRTLDFGDGNHPANARLDIPAGRVWAALFTVRLQ